MEATGPVAGGSVEVEGWEGGEMVLSPSSLAHGMEGVEVTEGSDEVEGWGGGEVVAGGEGERGAFCLPKGQYSGGGRGRGGKSASLVREDQAIMLAPGLGQNCDFLIYVSCFAAA